MTARLPLARPLALAAVVALAAPPPEARGQFTITPGTVVGIDLGRQIREYSFSGTVTETLTVTGLPSNPTGLAVVGSQVWVNDAAGNVGTVSLSTGAFSLVYNVGTGTEGLGSDGTNLFTINYNTGQVQIRNTSGTLIDQFIATGGSTGIDAAGGSVYLGRYISNGNIQVFNTSGTLTGTVTTGLPSDSVSALGYDPSNGTYWVATGHGDDRIRQFGASGVELTNFATGVPLLTGLDVVPVPEPATVLAIGAAGLGAVGLLRRRW